MVRTSWLVAAGVAGAVAFGGRPAVAEDATLVVHEWGTFSTASGSDGKRMRFTAQDRDLPKFVHYPDIYDSKEAWDTYVSMETPVLYFYTARPMTVTVSARLYKGRITENYPGGQPGFPGATTGAGRKGDTGMTWADVKLLPGADLAFPQDPKTSRYFAARETDAVPLQVTTGGCKNRKAEQEKFIFYRGVGDFETPMTVLAHGGGLFTVRNTGKEKLGAMVLVTVRGGQVRFAPLGALEPGVSVSAYEPKEADGADKLGALLTSMLTAEGLYDKEAKAMVKTWSSAWFAEEGARVLYLLPRPTTDEILPLVVKPAPAKTLRVMVGRHDVLTPEREREVDAAARKLNADPPAEERTAIWSALEKGYGRLCRPAYFAARDRVGSGK